MALLFSAPLTSTVTEFDAAQANGVINDPRGLSAPIPGYLEINAAPDGSSALMSRITPADAETYGGIRSEIDDAPQANAERWYVWETFFPSDFQTTDLLTFMQIHDSPDGGESPVKYPNFEFQTQSGMVFCTVPINCPDETSSNGRFPRQQRAPLITGRWVQCALHTNWGTDTSGFLEVYYDGKLLAKEWSRACGYSDAVGPYWKLGLYEFAHAGLTSEARAWYRNAKLYSTGHTAFGVLGVNPQPTSLTQTDA